jgi:Glycoside hydrolase 123, catalytic domain
MSRAWLRSVLTLFALAGAVLSAQRSSERTVFNAWAVHDGVKVKRDDRDHPDRLRNAVWDGRTIRLVAARNEVLAFQVIVEAGASGLEGLAASLERLTRRGGGGAIVYRPPATDPTEYRDRPIQVFSEHYMSVTRGSRATWVFQPDSATAPKNALGWMPVQLVPENAAPGRGGFPLRVGVNQNQALWFDIYVPRSIAAGSYHGAVLVSARGGAQRLPIELEVLDVQLPDDNTLPAMVYYQVDQPVLYHGRNLDSAYHRFAKRHRVEFVHAYDPERARVALGRLTGSDFTRDHGYEGPGEGVPNRTVPRTFYGPGPDFASLDAVWKTADEWLEFLQRELPHARTFLYMPDEPRPPRFPEIIALGERLKSNPGPGRKLPTLVTRSYTPELAPVIDIWAAGPQHYDIERAKSERAAGKEFWFYNGGRPAGGAIVIDSPATDPRVVGWAAFKHQADGYFYWHGVHWRHNNQKKYGDRNQDIWGNPVTFDNRTEGKDDNGFINGDGVLVYPGEEKLHPEQDRGIAGPISTIQMANLRRGLQDHALLTMARRLGLDREIDVAVNRLVPRVFSDAVSTQIGFSENGNDYEQVRRELLRAIAVRARSGIRH